MEEENDVIVDVKSKNQVKKSRFWGILFALWFLGSIVALIYCAKIENVYYTIMTFGQYFLVFSLVPLNGCEGKDKLLGIPFLLLGIGMVGVPLCMMNPQWFEEGINWEYIISILGILVFVLAGLAMVVLPWMEKRRLKKICTEIVDATIVRNQVKFSNRKKLYCPVYKFNHYNGEYEVSDNFYTNIGVKPVDTPVELKINPNNPKEFFIGKSDKFMTIQFMGIIFLIISVPIFIGMITGKL